MEPEKIWAAHQHRAQVIKVRGKEYLSSRWTPTFLQFNVQQPDEVPDVEALVKAEWGDETFAQLWRARVLLATDNTRRDMVASTRDTVDHSIPLSCVSMLQVLVVNNQLLLNVVSRSLDVAKMAADWALLQAVVAWLLEPLPGTWESWDPAVHWVILDFHEVVS